MRRLDLTFSALLLPLDFLALLAAATTAYALRFSKTFVEVRPLLQDLPFPQYLATAGFFAGIWLIVFAVAGLYTMRHRKLLNELGRIILACTAGIMVVIATVFFRREFTTSRFIVLAFWGLAIFYVWIFRLILRTMRHELLRARVGHQRFILVGQDEAAHNLRELYRTRPILGYTVVKTYKFWNETAAREMTKLREQNLVDGILLADSGMPKDEALDLIAFAEDNHLTFRYLADPFAARFTNIEVSTGEGIPIIEVKRTPLDGWGRIIKRTFDIVFSLLILLLASPILLLATFVLIIEDGLPVIFQNIRVGERGEPFKLYKLRSMWRKFSIGPQFEENTKKNLELEAKLIKQKSIKEGPVYKIAEDPRVTPIGRFIRRWSIDELPQFWNVLKGDMSIVGPRPHQPREVEHYLPHQRRVLAIKPGITGMAQISGRSDLTFEEEANLDTWYIEHWSPALDIGILLKTPFAVLNKKGAY